MSSKKRGHTAAFDNCHVISLGYKRVAEEGLNFAGVSSENHVKAGKERSQPKIARAQIEFLF